VRKLSFDFFEMNWDDQISYLIDNLRKLPDDLVEPGIDILVKAEEIEYAIVLAREHGMTKRAIEIAIEAGDYLWAAQIANQAGLEAESKRLYHEGLDYYKSMEMYGRAISAARALNLSPAEIDKLYRTGIMVERKKMNMGKAQAALESIMTSLEIELMGKDDEISKEVLEALQKEKIRKKEDL
jgi:thioredoxin-like negative regulator of GroEL